MSIINTNIAALQAQQAQVVSARQMSRAMTELSTGKRINAAADDAAGMAIGNKLQGQVIALNQAVRNAADGISMMQVADGAAEGITQMLVRMRELAVQAGNGVHVDSQRQALHSEFAGLRTQINQITSQTQWNGMRIVGGDKSTVTIQVGMGSTDAINVAFKNLWTSAVASGISGASISVVGSVGQAISGIDRAMVSIDNFRSTLGASMNRLQHASDNAVNVMTHTAASRSRVMDADYAKSTADLARAQIIQLAGTAMLSQANQSPRTVLMLLR